MVDTDTGEVIENEYGIFKTHEEIQKTKEKYLENEQRELERQLIKEGYKEYGRFSWLLGKALNMDAIDISTANIARLMYLATYVTYKNQLVNGNGQVITENGLQKLLKLNKTQFENFYTEVIGKQYLFTEDNKLYLSGDLCYKGKIHVKKHKDTRIVRLYHMGMRNLYWNCAVSAHKYLGYIFLLLPHTNIKYNYICKDIYETDIERIEFLPIGEICDILKYSRGHSSKLKEIFSKCKFKDGASAVGMLYRGSIRNWRMFINPRLYYSGNDHKTVEGLDGLLN